MTFVTVTALCSQLLRKEMVKRWHLIGRHPSKVQARCGLANCSINEQRQLEKLGCQR